jgi:hypothetical protein
MLLMENLSVFYKNLLPANVEIYMEWKIGCVEDSPVFFGKRKENASSRWYCWYFLRSINGTKPNFIQIISEHFKKKVQ